MNRLERIGQIFFAVALIAFGAGNFIVGDFIAGRAPAWPAGVPGRLIWSSVSGLLFVTGGLRVIQGKDAARACYVVAVMIFVWAALRQIPAVAADRQLGGAWTMFFKAIALSGGALGVAASLGAREHARTLLTIGRASLGSFLVLGGIQHFLFAAFVVTLVPTWIPGGMFWTYFAACALIAGGIGMNIPRTSRLAATCVGAMIFTWVIILHIPRAISFHNQNEWTAVIEALAFSGIAWSFVLPRQAV